MYRLLFIILFLCNSTFVFSQMHDYISLKKRNGRTVQNFYSGSHIIFYTLPDRGYHEGVIEQIADDSVYLREYQISYFKTIWGTTVPDTVNSFIIPFYYKQINLVYKDINGLKLSNPYVRNRFIYWLSKRAWIGAAGYIVLNSINSAYLGDRFTDKKNLKNLGIATGVFAAAFIIDKQTNPRQFRPRRYKMVYVRMN